MENREINKDIEKLIFEELKKSKGFWVDLFPLIDKSKYSYSEFYYILKELIGENKIKIRKGNNIDLLKLTKKGKLINNNELQFRIDKKGIKTKWYNQPWIGYLIAFITLLFAVYQGLQNKFLENQISLLKKSNDSLKVQLLLNKNKIDNLNFCIISLQYKIDKLNSKTKK